jgi:hypothetical protein
MVVEGGIIPYCLGVCSVSITLSITMGNESCSFPRILSKDFEVPDLKGRSSYGDNRELPDEAIVRSIFAQSF